MNLLICLVCPAFISIKVKEYLNKKKLNIKELIFAFIIYFLFINFLCGIVSVILFGATTSIENSLKVFPVYAVKYLLFAIIFSFVVPVIENIIEKDISFSVEIRKNKNEK